jgi:hypothetical protein
MLRQILHGDITTMKPKMLPNRLSPSTTAAPVIPLRWKWFITISTAGIVFLALLIALWIPSYTPVAAALAILGGHQIAFLILVQGARYRSNAPQESDG